MSTGGRVPLSSPSDLTAIVRSSAWLYTGAEGPPLARAGAAFEQYLTDRALAEEGRARHAVVEERVRARLGELLGLSPDDVGLVSNASEAMNLAAGTIDTRPGDNVVLNDLEFPSVVLPWLGRRAAGVEVRVARHRNGRLPVEEITGLVDERTRAVVLSHVSYMSGWRHDVEALSSAIAGRDARIVLDATQSLGVVPVPARVVDVVVSSSYKWLLGGHGVGVLAWNRARSPIPDVAARGWRSGPDLFTGDRFRAGAVYPGARRFERGFPAYPALYQLDASLGWLAGFDRSAIESHVLHLSGRLVDGMLERGVELLTSEVSGERAGNVAIVCDGQKQIAEALAREGVHCWGGDGRLRASVHLFNGDADVDRFFDAFDRSRKLSLTGPDDARGHGVTDQREMTT